MKKILLIMMCSNLLFSCGSVKKNKFSSSLEMKENVDISATTIGNNKSQTSENSSIRIENNGFNISIKPVNGQSSFFNFTSPDGHNFKGTTNAEINFEKKSEKKQILNTKNIVTETTYWSHVTYKSHITYKTITRYIDKYKESYPWYYILLAGFMLRELLRLLWNWLKKNNWYLEILKKFKK